MYTLSLMINNHIFSNNKLTLILEYRHVRVGISFVDRSLMV